VRDNRLARTKDKNPGTRRKIVAKMFASGDKSAGNGEIADTGIDRSTIEIHVLSVFSMQMFLC
jgi:hypothetical protein